MALSPLVVVLVVTRAQGPVVLNGKKPFAASLAASASSSGFDFCLS